MSAETVDERHAIAHGAPAEIVALIRALHRHRRAIRKLHALSSSPRAAEALRRIDDEIVSWTRDLGFGWRAGT